MRRSSTLATLTLVISAAVLGSPERDLAQSVVAKAGISRGLCAILGAGDGKLARELVRAGDFFVHAVDPDPTAAAAARSYLAGEGVYGTSAVVDAGRLDRLVYADNTVDLVIVVARTANETAPPRDEIMRVLRPGGKAIAVSAAGEIAADTKPRPAGTDSWSHWEHGPDNNAVSNDTVIRAPYRTQWMGGPLYTAMPGITTAAGGRVFTALGHIAHHEREEEWLNTLLARNGYNGRPLWTRKLPDGYLVHRSAFIATGDIFYLIDGDGCLLLDPETGRTMDRISIPGIDGDWKYIALQDGVLYTLIGKQKDPAETTVVRSPRTHWSWGELSDGYYKQKVPWGFGETLAAYDLAARKLLWRRAEEKEYDSRALAIGGGKLFFYSPGAFTGCLDARTGEPIWRNPDQEIIRLIEQPGRGLTSTPGFVTTCYAVYTPAAIVYQAQTHMNVVAISPADGTLLWTRKKTTNNPNVIFVDGKILVGIGPNGSTLVLDPATGETIEDLGFGKRSCARLTATPDSFFCRGMPDGLTRYDRAAEKVLFNGAFRPACNDGVLPANGLLYVGPWLCDCNLSLMGTTALCSAGDFAVEKEDPPGERLEAPGAGTALAPFPEATPADWPTYRGSVKRAACSPIAVPREPGLAWTFRPPRAYLPTAPVACGDLIVVGGDNGAVRALVAKTGALAWSFLTSGPVLAPATFAAGRVHVGSGDGFVYALEAATGRLLWRFRAAPVERRIMMHDRLCSTWPVTSGVLVQDGIAYVAAGVIDYDGTYVYALDAATGAVRWRNATSGHLNPELRKGVSAQGMLTIAQGKLWLPGGNVISPAAYDLATGECVTRDPGNGSPRTNRGEEIGLLRDDLLLLGGRLRSSAVRNHVDPGTFTLLKIGGGLPGFGALLATGKIPPAWSSDMIVTASGPKSVPQANEIAAIAAFLETPAPAGERRPARQLTALGRRWQANDLQGCDPIAFACAADAVLAVVEAPRPGSRFSAWQLVALDAKTGSVAWRRDLPGRALPGSLIVNRFGQAIVALEDGSIACFAPGT